MESNSNNQSAEPWMFEFVHSSNTPFHSSQYRPYVYPPVLPHFAEGGESPYGAQYLELKLSQEEHVPAFSLDEGHYTYPPSGTRQQTTIPCHYGPDGNMSNTQLLTNFRRPQSTTEVGSSGLQEGRAKSATRKTPATPKGSPRPKEKSPCIRCQRGSSGCKWPDRSDSCEKCKLPSRAVPWRVPCVPAQFLELVESGPCTTATRTEPLTQFNMLTLLKQAFGALNHRESEVDCGSDTISKDLTFKAFLDREFGGKTFKSLGTLGHFNSSQKCYFRPIAERLKQSTHLAVMALIEAKESFRSRDNLSDSGQLSKDTPCTGIAVEDMVKEAAEMLGDFICRETEIKMFRDIQDAVKQWPSDSAEDLSSLANRLLRALIWVKSTRGKGRASGLGIEYAVNYERRNRQLSLALYVHLRYTIKERQLLDAFWNEVDKFGLKEYLLPSSKKELEPAEENIQDNEVEKLISTAASKLISQEIAQYLQVGVESVHRVVSQLKFMVTLETHDG